MLSSLRWLALEVKDLDRAGSFYADHLELPVVEESDRELVLAAGDARLVLRRPQSIPRGGIHTHYAFSTPAEEYDEWLTRLSADFDVVEHQFGSVSSLYLYDPDGNCVEIGQSDEEGTGLTGIFEVVLEVEDLDRAEGIYADLGFEVADRGSSRRRVRLRGPVDLELWEPQLGIADGRGGVHVDIGFEADDPRTAADSIADRACAVDELDTGVRVRDPDGHYVTFFPRGERETNGVRSRMNR